MSERADLFRKRALDAESKAFAAKSDESRRAWMIVARDWTLMADKEDAKSSSVAAASAATPASSRPTS